MGAFLPSDYANFSGFSTYPLEHDIPGPLTGDEAARDLSLRITRKGEVPHAGLVRGEGIGLEWPQDRFVPAMTTHYQHAVILVNYQGHTKLVAHVCASELV